MGSGSITNINSRNDYFINVSIMVCRDIFCMSEERTSQLTSPVKLSQRRKKIMSLWHEGLRENGIMSNCMNIGLEIIPIVICHRVLPRFTT